MDLLPLIALDMPARRGAAQLLRGAVERARSEADRAELTTWLGYAQILAGEQDGRLRANRAHLASAPEPTSITGGLYALRARELKLV